MEPQANVKEQARHFAEQQKEAGAEHIGSMAGAIHGAAHELEDQMPKAAAYVHDAAARLESAAQSLRERNVDDIVQNLNSFARSQPAAFFGGAMLAGFAISRFLKSSGPTPGQDRQA
jgi:hypothetical protein